MTERVCSIEGCDAPYKARGWCKKHYSRWLKHGDPLIGGKVHRGVCSVEGCERHHKARGWCKKHYSRWLKHGDPLVALRVKASSETCSIDGCDAPYASRGWCEKHYNRWRRHGDPLIGGKVQRGVCSANGCGRPHEAKGLCKKHYLKNYVRHGTPCLVVGCLAQSVGKGYCDRHYRRLMKHGDPFVVGMPTPIRCLVCDHPEGDDPSASASSVARTIGVATDTIMKHRKRDHDNDPEWHAKRAAWWIAELAALDGMLDSDANPI